MTKTSSEHVLAVVKAGLNLVPVVGGSVASLIDDYVPTATQRNIANTLAELGKRLTELGNRVDTESIVRDEFAELFKSAYLVIVRTHQKDKLRAAAELIANVLLRNGDPEKLSYTELDHYVRCLDQLSVGAVEVLAHAVSLAEKENAGQLDSHSVRVTFEALQNRLPNVAPSLLMGLVGELDAHNLIHRAGVPAVRTADYGNYPLEVTPIGARFAKRLLKVI